MEIFIAAFLFALIVTLGFSYGYRRERRPTALFWFFILFFLPLWAISIWIPPYGPTFFGLAWAVPLFIAIALLTLLIVATSSEYFVRYVPTGEKIPVTEKEKNPRTPTGVFVWILFILLIVAIVVGYSENGLNLAGM